jgi:hypothetical protein
MMAENGNTDNLQAFTPEQVKKMFDFWADTLKLPTVGPMYAFSKDFSSYLSDFASLGKVMIELKSNMDDYWSLISAAYTRAMKEMMERAPKQLATKEDFEDYRRVAIEAFEDAFTELFTSPQFSEAYGRLFGSQLNVSRATQSIVERNFKMLNLPTRSEVDEMLKDIVELRRAVRDIKRSLEARND